MQEREELNDKSCPLEYSSPKVKSRAVKDRSMGVAVSELQKIRYTQEWVRSPWSPIHIIWMVLRSHLKRLLRKISPPLSFGQ